jgi:hypothetical protein
MSEERISELTAMRAKAYGRMLKSHKLFDRVNKLAESFKLRYNQDRRDYETADYELALLDGRFSVVDVEEVRSSRRPKSYAEEKAEPDFTEEQINRLAAKLGITLPEVPSEKIDMAELVQVSDEEREEILISSALINSMEENEL